MTDYDQLKSQLRRHEGVRYKPYRCTADKLTIGVGRNLDDVGISEAEVEVLFANDIERATLVAGELRVFHQLDPVRRCALINMAFQMGNRLKNFKKMLAALRVSDWDRAYREALDSAWAQQTPTRAQEVAAMLRDGEWR